MTVEELRAALAGMPGDVEVYVEDECCGCSNLADDAMYVDDRESMELGWSTPVVVITG